MATGSNPYFTTGTLEFLRDLKQNNKREWFQSKKADYENGVKNPAKAFAIAMEGELERLAGAAQKAKIFRINRDIRFSKDKTPYNTHIHMSWTNRDGEQGGPAFMFGLSPEYCTLGCGVFEFSKPKLETFRGHVAGGAGEKLAEIIGGLEKSGVRISEPDLKRVPSGFPADHRQARFLRHKGIAAWRDLDGPQDAVVADLDKVVVAALTPMLPLWRFLNDLT